MADEVEKTKDAIAGLSHISINNITRSLNYLIPKTCEIDKETLQFENYPELLVNIRVVLDFLNPISKFLIDRNSASIKQFELNKWPEPIISPANPYYHHVAKSVDANGILLAVLCLLRNLSFERMNESYIAHSHGMLAHLVSLLLISSDGLTECTRYVFDILSNVAKHIDVTAATRCRTNFYLEDCLELKQRNAIKLSVSSDMSIETADDYIFVAHSIMPILLRFIQTTTDRHGITRSLELISKLALVRENYDYFNDCPDELIEVLISLLCVTHSSIELLNPEKEPEKPPPSLGPYGEQADFEVRNGAIEALHALASNVPSLCPRIMDKPHVLRIMQRIIYLSDKRDLSPKMSQLFLCLAQHPDCTQRFLCIHENFFINSTTDDGVAELLGQAFNYIFPPKNEGISDVVNLGEPMQI